MKTFTIIDKIHKKVVLKVFITVFIFITIGCIYQQAMVHYESKKYKQPGRLIEVNNHKMHIYSDGDGENTVLFTVGSGTPSAYTDYYYIQKEISKITRTISYDRLGYGWSEKTATERNIHNIVDELHTLLKKSGEKAPYILVGHSLSSLEVLHFAQEYPDEVKGIVLIDGGNPEFYATLSEKANIIPMYILKGAGKCGLIRTLGNLGVLLPLTDEKKRARLLPEELSKIDKSLFFKSQGDKNNIYEVKNMNENANAVIDAGNIGNIPLIILTSEQNANSKISPEWNSSQEQLKDWSTNSKQQIVKESTHYIHWDKPNIVIEEIKDLIKGGY